MKTSEQIVNNGNTRAMCGICLKLRIDARTMFSVPLELILTKLISAEIILLYYLLQILKISLGSVKVTSLLIEVYREVRSLKLTVTIIWFLLKSTFVGKEVVKEIVYYFPPILARDLCSYFVHTSDFRD